MDKLRTEQDRRGHAHGYNVNRKGSKVSGLRVRKRGCQGGRAEEDGKGQLGTDGKGYIPAFFQG